MGLYELDFGTKVSRYPLKREEDFLAYEEGLNLFRSFRKRDVGTEKEVACLSYLKRYPDLIKVAGYESPAMIDVLIEENPYHIGYLDYPTEAVCLKVIRMNPDKFSDVFYDDPLQLIEKHLTPRICWEAIRQSGGRIRHIPQVFRTPRIWLEAMKQNPEAVGCLLEEKKLDFEELEELLWLIGITHNESLWEESFAPWLTGEFKWLAATGPRYRKDRPIQQSFYRLTDEMTLLMENFMFDCPNEVNPEPFFSTYINQQYERKSMAQTLELNPMVLMLMENRFKSFRLCRYAMRLIAKEEKGLLNELKRHSPYHLLEVLEAR